MALMVAAGSAPRTGQDSTSMTTTRRWMTEQQRTFKLTNSYAHSEYLKVRVSQVQLDVEWADKSTWWQLTMQRAILLCWLEQEVAEAPSQRQRTPSSSAFGIRPRWCLTTRTRTQVIAPWMLRRCTSFSPMQDTEREMWTCRVFDNWSEWWI